jgi:ubiquinone biosynthesis protein COQ9
MEDIDFDRALIAAAFAEAGASGWHRLSIAAAARKAGLDLARARARFSGRCALLLRFGQIADQSALTGMMPDAPVRDALFDMLMRRIDVLQANRAGVLALMRALPFDPAAAALLAAASLRSMAWLLDAAGVEAGPLAPLRAKGLLAVWLWTVRAWQRDETVDLAATMAALDHALGRAETVEGWLKGRPAAPEAAEPQADDAPPADDTPHDHPASPSPPPPA